MKPVASTTQSVTASPTSFNLGILLGAVPLIANGQIRHVGQAHKTTSAIVGEIDMSFSSEGASTDKMEYIYSDLLLPMMDLDDQNNFDYTSFLQDEPNFNVGEGSSTSACSQPLAITSRQSLSPPSSGPGVGSSSRQAKLKHERRGHTKSRNGCFNCKKRRIKVRTASGSQIG